MKKIILVLSFVLCISCTQEVDNGMRLPLKDSIGMDVKSGSIDILEEVSIIPLETTDESLLGECRIVDVCNEKIIVQDISSIYVFNRKTGKYESRIHRPGDGPEEYVSLSDVVVDCPNQLVYILDGKGNVKVYGYDSVFREVYGNDSIVSMEMQGNSNFVAYNGANEQCKYDINLYDKHWNIVKNLQKRNTKRTDYKDIIEVKDFNLFNGLPCFMNADTLCQISNEHINSLFYIDKGDLTLPFEVFTDIKRKKERASYIWGEQGFLAGKTYFLRFYYDNKIYYDVWDVSAMKLMYRNIVDSPADARGMSVLVDGKNVNIWPSFVKNDVVYCLLMDEEAKNIGFSQNNEENPIILAGRIKNM